MCPSAVHNTPPGTMSCPTLTLQYSGYNRSRTGGTSTASLAKGSSVSGCRKKDAPKLFHLRKWSGKAALPHRWTSCRQENRREGETRLVW